MVIVHGAWLEGEWLLWGEETPGNGEACVEGAGDAVCAEGPEPWGSRPDALAAALAAFESGGAADRAAADCRRRIAWLPTAGVCVAASRPWLRRGGSGDGALVPRRVWALPLRPGELFLVLAAAAANRRLAPGVLAGNDVGAWSDLFRYAGAIVARRQVLPGLCEARGAAADAAPVVERHLADTGYESRWTPVLNRAEQGRFGALAARLPPAAACLTVEATAPPAAAAPLAAAAAFLDEATDRLGRLASATTLSRAHAARGRYFSAHDAWAASLRGDARAIRWESRAEIAALAEEVARWRRPVERECLSSLSLCFHLEEPGAEDGPWRLRCRIRGYGAEGTAGADANGEADWDEVWRDRRLDAAVREEMLTALGQAALIAPAAIAGGVETARLTTAEAHRFMRNEAPVLQAAGFVVRLPAWWRQDDSQVRLVARVAAEGSPEAGSFTLSALVDVDWQIAIGGERVTPEELARLAEEGQALVRFRDRWIEINRAQVNEALRLWQRRLGEARAANDIVRMMLGIDRDAHGLKVAGVEAGGWLGNLMDRLRGGSALEPLEPPSGFRGTLRPYQARGYAWLAFLRRWGLGACLADDMGLGKTIQALALLARERERGERRPALLVCPTSMLTNWAREAARFVPDLPVRIHHGSDRSVSGTFAEESAAAALVITSYTLLYRDYASIRQVAWAGVILDEAQNIKNPDTRQAQAARAIQADYRVALTGTPVENHVGDLWSIMDFLNPGLLGSRAAFRETFALPIRTGTDPDARDRLRQTTAPFVLRRLKTDRDIIRDLPEKREACVYCTLTREQAALYQGVVDELGVALKSGVAGIGRRGLVLASITRLKQICNHPVHFLGDGGELPGRSGKLDRLREMIEEVAAAGDAALVFTQYAAMGAILQRHLQREFGCFVPFLHGGTPRADRDAQVAAFQAHPGAAVFVLSLKAGGTGLNLTRANHVFHFDRWWNPAVENQATDRAFRIGQTRDVMVHKFVCAGTLEERIEAMIRNKTALADDLVASGEGWLTELDDADLREALALSRDAVGEWTP